MRPRLAPPTMTARWRSSLAALLLSTACGPAVASSGVEVDCRERVHELPVADIVAPSLHLNLERADHGLTSSAAIDDPDIATPRQSSASPKPPLSPLADSLLQEIFAESDATVFVQPSNRTVASPELADSQPDANAEDGEQGNRGLDEAASLHIEIPVTTTRLPGVSEVDSPRIRRQMYRTDI